MVCDMAGVNKRFRQAPIGVPGLEEGGIAADLGGGSRSVKDDH